MGKIKSLLAQIIGAGAYEGVRYLVITLISSGVVVSAAAWLGFLIDNITPLSIVTASIVSVVAIQWGFLGLYQWWNRDRRKPIEALAQQIPSETAKPYDPSWEDGNAWCLWHVACLWVGEEPHLPIVHGTMPYPRLKILEGDIKLGFLEVIERVEPEMAWWVVSMPDLIEYCHHHGYEPIPKFLSGAG